MTATLEQRLARLKHYSTRYELIAEHPDGRRYLVIYTTRRSRAGLQDGLLARLEDGSLDRVIGTREMTYGRRAADGVTMGDWRVRFSGRTQRECYIQGELTFLADA